MFSHPVVKHAPARSARAVQEAPIQTHEVSPVITTSLLEAARRLASADRLVTEAHAGLEWAVGSCNRNKESQAAYAFALAELTAIEVKTSSTHNGLCEVNDAARTAAETRCKLLVAQTEAEADAGRQAICKGMEAVKQALDASEKACRLLESENINGQVESIRIKVAGLKDFENAMHLQSSAVDLSVLAARTEAQALAQHLQAQGLSAEVRLIQAQAIATTASAVQALCLPSLQQYQNTDVESEKAIGTEPEEQCIMSLQPSVPKQAGFSISEIDNALLHKGGAVHNSGAKASMSAIPTLQPDPSPHAQELTHMTLDGGGVPHQSLQADQNVEAATSQSLPDSLPHPPAHTPAVLLELQTKENACSLSDVPRHHEAVSHVVLTPRSRRRVADMSARQLPAGDDQHQDSRYLRDLVCWDHEQALEKLVAKLSPSPERGVISPPPAALHRSSYDVNVPPQAHINLVRAHNVEAQSTNVGSQNQIQRAISKPFEQGNEEFSRIVKGNEDGGSWTAGQGVEEAAGVSGGGGKEVRCPAFPEDAKQVQFEMDGPGTKSSLTGHNITLTGNVIALTATQNNTSVCVHVGDLVTIALPANPASGFRWVCATDMLNSALHAVDSVEPINPASMISTNLGTQQMRFIAVEPGQGYLSLRYELSHSAWFEEGEADISITISVNL